jgi:CRISPR-associated protein Cas2
MWPSGDGMKKFVVIAYDIEDDKRRRQVSKLLEAVGLRVNKSVFECLLSEARLVKLQGHIAKKTVRGDSVLYYLLCRSCIEKVERSGTDGLPTQTVLVL